MLRLLLVAVLIHAVGCQYRGGGVSLEEAVDVAIDDAPAPAVVAYVRGKPVTRAELMAPLVEAAGAEVFSELVLEAAVADRLEARGLAVTPEDLEAQRQILLGELSSDPNQAQQLLSALRRRRGLGPERFERLLRRTAGLRKLVEGNVEVTDAEVRVARRILYGPRVSARLIVVETVAEAERLRRELDGATADAFAQAATARSTDDSSTRGGLLAPVHPEDPSYPAVVRRTLGNLAPGELSDVVAVDNGYALIRVEAIVPGRAGGDDVDDEALRLQIRRRSERLAMQQLAAELVNDAEVRVLDPGLKGWRP